MGFRKPETYGEEEWRSAGDQVQAMIRQGWRVWAVCQAEDCRTEIKVPLLAIASAKGGSYSLWGETIPCKVVGCRGRMAFVGQPPARRSPIALTPPPGRPSKQREAEGRPADRLPGWAQTAASLYAMVQRNGYCNYRCAVCGGRGPVDLVQVICKHGLGFSLIDRVGSCGSFSCNGAVFFTAGPAFGQIIRLATGPLPTTWDSSVPEAMVCRVRY